MVQPVMRSLRRNHGRPRCQQARMKDQGDGASGTDRREWSRARSTVSNLQRTWDQRDPSTPSGSGLALLALIWPFYQLTFCRVLILENSSHGPIGPFLALLPKM